MSWPTLLLTSLETPPCQDLKITPVQSVGTERLFSSSRTRRRQKQTWDSTTSVQILTVTIDGLSRLYFKVNCRNNGWKQFTYLYSWKGTNFSFLGFLYKIFLDYVKIIPSGLIGTRLLFDHKYKYCCFRCCPKPLYNLGINDFVDCLNLLRLLAPSPY